jgi:hypothetical protein
MRATSGKVNTGNRNKTTPCFRCKQPAYGDHCRACSFIVSPVAHRKAMNRNPEWGSGENGRFAVVLTKAVPPSSSWWLEKDFSAALQRELPRMLAATVSGNAPNVIE